MIPLAKPLLDEKEAQAAYKTILSGWVTQGPKVQEFEEAFAAYVGAKHACAVSNCTTALQLSFLVLGVQPGDFVVTVSHSFIGTANSVRSCGAEPVFVDIDPQTYNMCPKTLDALLKDECVKKGEGLYYKNVDKLAVGESPLVFIDKQKRGRIAAIMPVHQVGMPCDLKAILQIAKKYHLPVVEDAACAIGCEIQWEGQWEKIGKPHGDIACFSFHPRKIMTTGDGGMITTNNAQFDQKLRLLRNHGMNISGAERLKAKKFVLERYLMTAFNYRMTDIQAAVGIAQLEKVPEFIKQRRKIGGYYRKYFAEIDWLELPFEPDYARANWQSYLIRLLKNAPLGQTELMHYLFENGVATIPGVMNAHQESPYLAAQYSLKHSEEARKEAVIFPFYVGLAEQDIKKMSEILKRLETRQGITSSKH